MIVQFICTTSIWSVINHYLARCDISMNRYVRESIIAHYLMMRWWSFTWLYLHINNTCIRILYMWSRDVQFFVYKIVYKDLWHFLNSWNKINSIFHMYFLILVYYLFNWLAFYGWMTVTRLYCESVKQSIYD